MLDVGEKNDAAMTGMKSAFDYCGFLGRTSRDRRTSKSSANFNTISSRSWATVFACVKNEELLIFPKKHILNGIQITDNDGNLLVKPLDTFRCSQATVKVVNHKKKSNVFSFQSPDKSNPEKINSCLFEAPNPNNLQDWLNFFATIQGLTVMDKELKRISPQSSVESPSTALAIDVLRRRLFEMKMELEKKTKRLIILNNTIAIYDAESHIDKALPRTLSVCNLKCKKESNIRRSQSFSSYFHQTPITTLENVLTLKPQIEVLKRRTSKGNPFGTADGRRESVFGKIFQKKKRNSSLGDTGRYSLSMGDLRLGQVLGQDRIGQPEERNLTVYEQLLEEARNIPYFYLLIEKLKVLEIVDLRAFLKKYRVCHFHLHTKDMLIARFCTFVMAKRKMLNCTAALEIEKLLKTRGLCLADVGMKSRYQLESALEEAGNVEPIFNKSLEDILEIYIQLMSYQRPSFSVSSKSSYDFSRLDGFLILKPEVEATPHITPETEPLKIVKITEPKSVSLPSSPVIRRPSSCVASNQSISHLGGTKRVAFKPKPCDWEPLAAHSQWSAPKTRIATPPPSSRTATSTKLATATSIRNHLDANRKSATLITQNETKKFTRKPLRATVAHTPTFALTEKEVQVTNKLRDLTLAEVTAYAQRYDIAIKPGITKKEIIFEIIFHFRVKAQAPSR